MNNWFRRGVTIVLALLVASLPVYAGEGGDKVQTRDVSITGSADQTTADTFIENLDTLHPDDVTLERAVDALRLFRDSYERHDLPTVVSLLAQDFELVYLVGSLVYVVGGDGRKLGAFIQSREDFIDKRRGWQNSSKPLIELRMAVKTVQYWPDLGITSIAVATTYYSRHFNPRFLEVYIFEDRSGTAKLARLSMTPLHPASADDYEVGIYFVRPEPPIIDLRWSNIREDMIAMGPDAAFDKYVKMMSTISPRVPRDRLIKVLIIFREPPPGGAKVVVRQKSYRGDDTNVYDVITVSRNGDPYFFITGRKWWGHNVGVNVEVTVDGVLVGEELLRIR